MELVRFEPFARVGNFRWLFNDLVDDNLAPLVSPAKCAPMASRSGCIGEQGRVI